MEGTQVAFDYEFDDDPHSASEAIAQSPVAPNSRRQGGAEASSPNLSDGLSLQRGRPSSNVKQKHPETVGSAQATLQRKERKGSRKKIAAVKLEGGKSRSQQQDNDNILKFLQKVPLCHSLFIRRIHTSCLSSLLQGNVVETALSHDGILNSN